MGISDNVRFPPLAAAGDVRCRAIRPMSSFRSGAKSRSRPVADIGVAVDAEINRFYKATHARHVVNAVASRTHSIRVDFRALRAGFIHRLGELCSLGYGARPEQQDRFRRLVLALGRRPGAWFYGLPDRWTEGGDPKAMSYGLMSAPHPSANFGSRPLADVSDGMPTGLRRSWLMQHPLNERLGALTTST